MSVVLPSGVMCLWCGRELWQRYLFCDELCSMMAQAQVYDLYLAGKGPLGTARKRRASR